MSSQVAWTGPWHCADEPFRRLTIQTLFVEQPQTMLNMRSSNPALTNYARSGPQMASYEKRTTAEISGIVNKTAILVTITIIGGVVGYAVTPTIPWILWVAMIGSLIFGLIAAFAIGANPARAKWLSPPYAILQGVFLGGFTYVISNALEQGGYQVSHGVALQAFIITLCIMVSMLSLYKAKIIKPTRLFQSVFMVLMGGIFLTFIASFIVSFIEPSIGLPFISPFAGIEGGQPTTWAWVGLGFNILVLGVAAMGLIMDFKLCEDIVEKRQPKAFEWFGAFALLVSLVWIYFEALKLVARMTVLTGGND